MKKAFFLGSALIICSLVIGAVLILKHTYASDNTVYTCQANGTYLAQNTGPAALTSSDLSKVSLANAWLNSMMKPDVTTVTTSTITPDVDYANSYTGPTAGSFVLNDRTYPTTNPASIAVTSPTTVADSYRGVISGHVTVTPQSNRWIIQAYKNNGGTITQVPVQALADGTTGDFSIDLSGVSGSYTGQWMLGILDANNSYAEYGVKWPAADVYTNLVVQELVVTDTTYLWHTTPATTDGRFAFDDDQVGAKMFRLVDSSTDEILAQSFDETGLIRSYEYASNETGYGTGIQDLTYLYDQALALYSATSQNESTQAKLLVDGLLKMQTTTGAHAGGFVFAAPQLSPSYTDPYYRTGAVAIAIDALLSYIQKYPADPNIASYTAAAVQGLTFIQSLYSNTGATAGLYLGGYGEYSGSPQTFDPNYVVTFASTEHNIDIWHLLTDASRTLGDGTTNYSLLATNLGTAIKASLYNTTEKRFNQGINGGVADTGDPLDTNSWGSIELYGTGDVSTAQQSLAHLTTFSRTINGITGYTPFYDTLDYPGAVPNVWFEGSFGVALAQFDAGDYSGYRTTIDNLTPAQQTDGSFRYAQVVDSTYDIGVSESVASTAWFTLATAGRGTIWNNCVYVASNVAAVASSGTTPSVTTSQPATNSIKSTSSQSISTEELSQSTTPADPDTVKASSNSAGAADNTGKTTTKTNTPSATSGNNIKPILIIAGAGVGVVAIGLAIGFGIARARRRG